MAKPVHALVGDDSFLQIEKLQAIEASLGKDVQRTDFDGETAGLAEVLDELRCFAMFGDGKLVVVRNADDFISRFRESLEEFLQNPPASGTLVLRVNSLPKNQRIYKIIAKVGSIEPCEPPKDLRRWVIERGRSAHRIAVAPDAADALVELLGDSLGRLDNELAKLALNAPAGKVAAGDVANVSFQREQAMWDLTNELAAGQPTEALRRWRNLVQLDPSTEFRAVTWLTMWLEEMRQALAGQTGGKVAWKYRDRLPLLVRTARQFGPHGIADALDLLAEMDRRTKTGLGGGAENVERFILSLGLRGVERGSSAG